MSLSAEQLEVKVAFLKAENERLRDALLDCQIRAGDISLQDNNKEEGK